jgi:hypothetical protein
MLMLLMIVILLLALGGGIFINGWLFLLLFLGFIPLLFRSRF